MGRNFVLPVAVSWLRVRCSDAAIGGCTAIGVTSGASADGGAMAGQTADSDNADFRVAYVPARDHPVGATRPVYRGDGNHMMYPRNTDTDRSPQYLPVVDAVHPSEIVGHIPQVSHTYALWEGLYGMMNEHGVGFGESTCCANQVGVGVPQGGNAIFTIGNLMSVALERCQTSRCAVQTMGDLAEQFGYYGEDEGVDGAGEALTVTDRQNDVWVFHIAGGVPNRTGALWVAQRVPDGHVAVIANSFIIQEVDMSDTENFFGSRNLLEDAKVAGLWDGVGKFNWQKYLAPDYHLSFEANINFYDPLRMWRIFGLAAPTLHFPAMHKLGDYPFSVKADHKATLSEVMDWFRDTYTGTPFDMQLGALAGQWGSPRRFDAGADVSGQYARSVSVSWSAYSIITHSGIKHPALWYAADSAATSVFVPFYSEALRTGTHQQNFAVKEYGQGSMLSFSLNNPREEQPAWWAFSMVADWMQISYRNMSQQYVFPKVQALQRYVARVSAEIEREADEAGEAHAIAGLLAGRQTELQKHVAKEWWDLAGMLIQRYKDQKFNFPPNAPTECASIGMPGYWAEMIGYDGASYYPRWVKPAVHPPSLLPAADLPAAEAALAQQGLDRRPVAIAIAGTARLQSYDFVGSHLVLVALAIAVCTLGGVWVGHAAGYRRGLEAASCASDGVYLRVAA